MIFYVFTILEKFFYNWERMFIALKGILDKLCEKSFLNCGSSAWPLKIQHEL